MIADRFRLRSAPTLLTRTASVAPIGFSHLRSRQAHTRAREAPYEAAYAIHVALQPVTADLWTDGRHALSLNAVAGDTFLFDLRCNPVSELHTPFDIFRFYISQQSLDELAFDSGQHRTIRLATTRLGTPDKVMFGLAQALIDPVERADERSTLFVDHIGLAFHAHVAERYGAVITPERRTHGRLSPAQWRRSIDYMNAHLDGDPTIAQLAQECGLSASYFARAFRLTAGMTPHKWLVRQRVDRARSLLLLGSMELAAIAASCGFVDQSHFSRVFTRVEGESPGRWRRRHR